ncbi:TVP38/TMEM64 family protein [Methanobacterium sp. MBAC-LM]|uniref:TVP38/TMEM64 family protein n=1 Tax=Methanobacterium sp. MBAC-LM TaxID=3412034 RepID=UPI003C74E67A
MQNKINLETRIGIKWILLTFIILTLLLIPFVLFGDSLDNWTNSFFQSESSKLIASLVIGFLLSIDIIAPVPSSILSTAGGYFLGFIGGTLISLVGMTISCLIGYWIGAKLGRAAALRFVDTKEISGFESLQKKYGDWIIIISRSIPLLAETSVLFAGIGRMKFNRFIFMVTISNLGISMVYAAVGAYSAHINSFLFAFAAAIIFPGVMIVILKNKKILNSD